MKKSKSSPQKRGNQSSNSLGSSENYSAVEDIRKTTIEIQTVHQDLAQLAEYVSHSRDLYGQIMDANDRYSELIGRLVRQLKAAADIKIQSQATTIESLNHKVSVLKESAGEHHKEVHKESQLAKELENELKVVKEQLFSKTAEASHLENKLEKVAEKSRIAHFQHFEERKNMADEIRRLQWKVDKADEAEARLKYELEQQILDMFGGGKSTSFAAAPAVAAAPVAAAATTTNTTAAASGPSLPSPPVSHSSSPSKASSKAFTIGSNRGGGGILNNPTDRLMAAMRRAKEVQQQAAQEAVVAAAASSKLGNMSKASDFKRPMKESSAQTEVDLNHCVDDNSEEFFDIAGGWVLPVSGTIIARRRWRKAFAFAKCPFCRGVGNSIAQVASVLRSAMHGDVKFPKKAHQHDALLAAPEEGSGPVVVNDAEYSEAVAKVVLKKATAEWKYTGKWTSFICHLPKPLQHKGPFYEPRHVIARLWNLLVLRERCLALADEALNNSLSQRNNKQHPHERAYHHLKCPNFVHEMAQKHAKHEDEDENMVDFTIDSYLLTTATRLDAEKQLFMLLSSMKDFWTKGGANCHPLVRMFARFVAVLDGPMRNKVDPEMLPSLEREYFQQDAVSIATSTSAMGWEELQRVTMKVSKAEELEAGRREELQIEEEERLRVEEAEAAEKRKKDASEAILMTSKSRKGAGSPSKRNLTLEDQNAKAQASQLVGSTQVSPDKVLHHEFAKKITISDNSLSDDMLSAYLLIRSCLLHEPYNGVYADTVALAKRRCVQYRKNEAALQTGSVDLDAFAQAHATHGHGHGLLAHSGKLRWEELYVPGHALVDANFNVYIPLDRAMRVIQGVFGLYMNSDGLMKLYRDIENNNVMLMDPVNFTLSSPEFERVFIRTTMRKFTRNKSADGSDMGWDDKEVALRDKLRADAREATVGMVAGNVGGLTKGSTGKKATTDAIEVLNKANQPLMVNLDSVLALIVEKLSVRLQYSEIRLKKYFQDALKRRKNTLTFSEFSDVFRKLLLRPAVNSTSPSRAASMVAGVKGKKASSAAAQAAHGTDAAVVEVSDEEAYEERRMVQIYRSLLMRNNEKCPSGKAITKHTTNNVSVESLMAVSKQYRLLKVVNEYYLREYSLKGLCGSAEEDAAAAEAEAKEEAERKAAEDAAAAEAQKIQAEAAAKAYADAAAAAAKALKSGAAVNAATSTDDLVVVAPSKGRKNKDKDREREDGQDSDREQDLPPVQGSESKKPTRQVPAQFSRSHSWAAAPLVNPNPKLAKVALRFPGATSSLAEQSFVATATTCSTPPLAAPVPQAPLAPIGSNSYNEFSYSGGGGGGADSPTLAAAPAPAPAPVVASTKNMVPNAAESQKALRKIQQELVNKRINRAASQSTLDTTS